MGVSGVKRMITSAKGHSYNVGCLVVDAVDFKQSVIAILFVFGPWWEIKVGELVHRQEILVDALAKREVGLRHIGAIVVVESTGTDVLVG